MRKIIESLLDNRGYCQSTFCVCFYMHQPVDNLALSYSAQGSEDPCSALYLVSFLCDNTQVASLAITP